MKTIFYLIIFCTVCFSSNSKAQWVQSGLDGYFVRTINVSGTNLFVGTSGDGIFRSTNNSTSWTAVNSGLTNLYVNAFTVSGTNLFAGTEGNGVYRSTNNGASWSATGTLSTPYIYALTVSGTDIFAGADGDGVFRSTNNGTTWTLVSTGLTNTRIFALTASGTNLYAGTFGGAGVYRSTNNGANWTPAGSGLTNTSVNTLLVSDLNLFAGTEDGIFLSTNNGTSWTSVSVGLTNTFVHALTISGTNLYAGTEDGVFRSTNNGTNWTAVSDGLTNPTIFALVVYGTNLFAGSNGNGVWIRPIDSVVPVELTSFTANTNGNNVNLSWSTSTETNNSGFHIERSVISNPNGMRNLFWENIGFVNGNGTTTETKSYSFADNNLNPGKYLYRLKQIDFDGTFEYSNEIEVTINAPEKFELSQNYPHPFNPSTTIRYTIPNVTLSGVEGSRVQLKIYDVLGNEVATLVNEVQSSGNYEVTFDASLLSSGTYFYKLQAGELVQTKKMILMK